MKFHFNFLHVDVSTALQTYTQESLGKVGRLILKNSTWHVCYSKTRHQCQTQVDVNSPWGHFKAKATGETFYLSVDAVAEKLGKQLMKRKGQLQHHKNFDKSKGGKVRKLSPDLAMDHQIVVHKKIA